LKTCPQPADCCVKEISVFSVQCSENPGRSILLAGRVDEVFSDSSGPDVESCFEIRADLAAALEAAAGGRFETVAVAVSCLGSRPSRALGNLRRAAAPARLVLLARMWEEPEAAKLLEPAGDGAAGADDYLICPVRARQLRDCLLRRGGGTAADTAVTARIAELEKLATEDELTGLRNRRYIWEFCRQAIERARRRSERVTLLLFDIDDFKRYNDLYGHATGDEILKQAAVVMKSCCRQHDVVGRIGGDEFAVVFWDEPRSAADRGAERRSKQSDHPAGAVFIAGRFRREIESTNLHLLGPTGKGVLSISGGLASFPRSGSTAEELFQRADEALLEAKRSGKNRIYLVGRPNSDMSDLDG
jgi:diguanylate cyclase (GGDEF)-like protein